MFKNIKKILDENYKGKKYMELPPHERDRLSSILKKDVSALAEYMGAEAIAIYMKEPSASAVLYDKMGFEETLDMLEYVLERANIGIESNVLSALHAYDKTNSENGDTLPRGLTPDKIMRAFNDAIADLPPEQLEAVSKRMEGLISGEVLPKFMGKNDDEDSLLDDLLK